MFSPVLGIYTPELQQIKIFNRGIVQVAERLDLRQHDITFVVRLHEWAHALIHVGLPETERLRVEKDETSWPTALASATDAFRRLESGLHERLAQLIVHHGLESLRSAASPEAQVALDRITAAFEKLMRHAPIDYRIEKYASVPLKKVVSSIALLKNGGLTGLTAWDTVITW